MSATRQPAFVPIAACWICGHERLSPGVRAVFDLTEYREQDPDLAAYTGQQVQLQRCCACGFAQPDAVPALPHFFERMYDQRWTNDWLEREFESGAKDFIFRTILHELDRRVPADDRRMLDVGAHVGRFIHLAQAHGWTAEGIELNPRTSAFAEQRTGTAIHRRAVQELVAEGKRYRAVTFIDVLEHIPEPVAALCDAAQALERDGWIAIKVPCGRNQVLKERIRSLVRRTGRVPVADNLVHINHFSPRALRLALARAGFDDISVRVAAPEMVGREKGRPSMLAAAANATRLIFYSLGRSVPGGVHTPLAFNLEAYGRRR